MKKILAAGLVLALSPILGATSGPASASQGEGIVQIVDNLAPGLLAETADADSLATKVEDEVAQSGAVRLLSSAPDRKSIISLAVSYVRTTKKVRTGLTLMSGVDPAVFALSQSTSTGFRVITALVAKPSDNKFQYKFAVPANTELEETPNNFLLVNGEKVLGTLAQPWAVDARGSLLKTHFMWTGTELTQVLDEDLSTIAYPVILDPAWGYVYQYDLTNSPATNMSRIRTCFNCYFPVAGAPKAYPRQGQLLPLTVGFFNFECTMGPTFQSADYASFEFYATKNHIDGAGSNIIFQFTHQAARNYLVVDAYIVNSLDLIRAPYMGAAGLNWQIFANNLNSISLRT